MYISKIFGYTRKIEDAKLFNKKDASDITRITTVTSLKMVRRDEV